MKRVIFICMAVLFATGIASAQKTESKASIAIAEEVYQFGNMKENEGKVSHTFAIKNDGSQPLVITRVTASCGCTTPEWTKEAIAPGKTGELIVTFDPSGRPGPFTKTVTIFSNSKQERSVIIIAGNVI